mgnify:CR=1 FL=1
MPSKRENIAKELKNPRTRLIFIGGFVIIAIVLLAGYALMARRQAAAEEQLSSSVAPPPEMNATSGMQGGKLGTATPAYDEVIGQGNAQAVEDARREGGSAIPTPRTGVETTPVGPDVAQPQPQPATPGVTTSPTPTQSADQREQQRRQAWEQQVQARVAAMKGQLGKIQGYWSITPHQRYQVASVEGGRVAQEGASPASSASESSNAALSGDRADPSVETQATDRTRPDINMGQMFYATLDFGINTDDPASASFVQATIREPGPFQGAKVLGALQEGDQYAKTVGIHFTQMKVPGEAGTRAIDAWAVSPNTQRAALASRVNNHYLSRGFSTIVGSFLEGYSAALLQGGRQQNVVAAPNGSVIVQQDAYSDKQLMQVAVGNVGKNMSQVFAQSASRQRTVTVNPGADLGVWFLKDVTPTP